MKNGAHAGGSGEKETKEAKKVMQVCAFCKSLHHVDLNSYRKSLCIVFKCIQRYSCCLPLKRKKRFHATMSAMHSATRELMSTPIGCD